MSAAPCPENRCDGSGFLYDDAGRRARPCSCRPARMARKRAAAVAGRLPRRFREVSFDREPVLTMTRRNPALIREVRSYVLDIRERLDEGLGLWFTGDVGTGKTTLAMLVSKAAMEADRTVAIYSLPRLLGLLRDSYDDQAAYSLNELLDRLCAVDLLHIDDVGAEQSSPWVLEQLYTIVNTRYEDGRALLLTTNLDHDALTAQIGARTVSRLYEMCGRPLPMFGEDERRDRDFVLPAGAGGGDDEDAFWEGAAPASRYGRRGGGSLD
ncbi:MAG TPA: ATP-binding protein [Solirubrobacteraceae bacterium]|nr:ATP-binding protein [Solirubrobacteraceae bacterium]